MDLDKVLASTCRRKILRVLSETGCTNIMDLVQKVNSNYSQVNRNLQILGKEGVVIDRRFERRRIIKLNKQSHKAELLSLVLKILANETALENRVTTDSTDSKGINNISS